MSNVDRFPGSVGSQVGTPARFWIRRFERTDDRSIPLQGVVA